MDLRNATIVQERSLPVVVSSRCRRNRKASCVPRRPEEPPEEEETDRATAKEDEEEKLLSTRKTQGPVIFWKSIAATIPTQGQKKDSDDKVLRDVSRVAYPNGVLAIMEGSGAGKTTLMSILAYLKTKRVEKTSSVLVNGSQVVQTMQMLAKEAKTVILVIYQPSSSTLNMFNKVPFMANVHPTYHGSVSELCRFFESVARSDPESYNPTDHAISQLAVSPDTKERDNTQNAQIRRNQPARHERFHARLPSTCLVFRSRFAR